MKKYILILLMLMATPSLMPMQQAPSSSLSPAFFAGKQALREQQYWLAISKLDPVFKLEKNPSIKAEAALLLGFAYRRLGEPHLAYYYFDFAAHHAANINTQQIAQEELNLKELNVLKPVVTSKETSGHTKPAVYKQRTPAGYSLKN